MSLADWFGGKAGKSFSGTVAFNMRPVKGPWGGSSVYVHQMKRFLEFKGYKVRFDLNGPVDVIVIIDPRDDLQYKAFGLDAIAEYKKQNPQVRVLHRINECDQRKGTDFMDDELRRGNDLADGTLFISAWLRDYFVERWFDAARSHVVVYNGADTRFFHPVGRVPFVDGQPIRMVTHHWSDNPMKGFPVYEELDRLIANGELPGVEFMVVGRWPDSIQWKAARTHGPASGNELADLLRQNHLYITASQWEPCGMHHVEGMQCGLPIVYHKDGGGIVEASERCGLGFTNNLSDVIREAVADYRKLEEQVYRNMPSGDRMVLQNFQYMQQLIAGAKD